MAQDFDRIMRENFEGIVMKSDNLSSLPFQFNYKVLASIFTPNITKTLERKIDFAKIVEDKEDANRQTVLHIEFQTEPEKRMVVRMQLYLALIQDWVELPVKQYVIYLGERPANMATHMQHHIPGNTINYHYQLIEIRNLQAEDLLLSDTPEIIVLAILASRGNVDPLSFVVKVLKRLKAVCHSQEEVDKFVLQLVTMSSLRNLDEVITENREDLAMNTGISIKDNAVYKHAFSEGEAKTIQIVKAVMRGKSSIQQIAEDVGVSLEKVLKVKKELEE